MLPAVKKPERSLTIGRAVDPNGAGSSVVRLHASDSYHHDRGPYAVAGRRAGLHPIDNPKIRSLRAGSRVESLYSDLLERDSQCMIHRRLAVHLAASP